MKSSMQTVLVSCLVRPGARSTLDFAGLDDHARLPWRFLARHLTLRGLLAA